MNALDSLFPFVLPYEDGVVKIMPQSISHNLAVSCTQSESRTIASPRCHRYGRSAGRRPMAISPLFSSLLEATLKRLKKPKGYAVLVKTLRRNQPRTEFLSRRESPENTISLK